MEKIYVADPNAHTLSEAMAGHKVAEISKDWYWEIYGGVPPIGYHPTWMCGEPYDHNEHGVALYQMMFEYKGHFYAGPYLPADTDIAKVKREIIRDYHL